MQGTQHINRSVGSVSDATECHEEGRSRARVGRGCYLIIRELGESGDPCQDAVGAETRQE